MRGRMLLLIAFAVFAIPASGSAATPATLAGQVVSRSTGLGCLREPCWRPLAKVPVTIQRDERVVKRTISGPDGRFRVDLAAGVYTVRAPGLLALTPALAGTGALRATLLPGSTTRLTLVIFSRTADSPGGRL